MCVCVCVLYSVLKTFLPVWRWRTQESWLCLISLESWINDVITWLSTLRAGRNICCFCGRRCKKRVGLDWVPTLDVLHRWFLWSPLPELQIGLGLIKTQGRKVSTIPWRTMAKTIAFSPFFHSFSGVSSITFLPEASLSQTRIKSPFGANYL